MDLIRGIALVALAALAGCTVYQVPPASQPQRYPAASHAQAPGYHQQPASAQQGPPGGYAAAPAYGYYPGDTGDTLQNPYSDPAPRPSCDCRCSSSAPPPGDNADAYRGPNPDRPSDWLE